MSRLTERVDSYLAIRRALGHKLDGDERLLRQFIVFLAARGETRVTIDAAVAWAATATTDSRLAARLTSARGFATYLAAFDPDTEIPPPHLVVHPVVRRAPCIFDEAEITGLMAAAGRLSNPVMAATFPTLIGLMACTGIRTSEAMRLDVGDVDLDARLLSIRYSKYGKSRRIPIHPTTTAVLGDYLKRRAPHQQAALLLAADGERLSSRDTAPTFRRLTAEVGIAVPPGRRPARLSDLRHTFAVSTLLGWHAAGCDVTTRLPLLSIYLGHVNPAHTYWYVQAVPPLMSVLAERLEAFLGSPS